MRTRVIAALMLAALFTVPDVSAQGAALPPMPTVSLQIGARVIKAEVLSSTNERTRGMMYRRTLAPDAGMLFVFGREQGGEVCMWMKHTSVPLSAAFIDRDGRIINIADMEPHSETVHCAAARAEYVLEVNRGLFSVAGVKPGARIGGLPVAR
jgi:hypothetical protein